MDRNLDTRWHSFFRREEICTGLLDIIMRGDMNKAPVRMWLFSLVTLLEVIEKLHNEVAHGNDLLLVHSQRNLPDCAQQTERLLEQLEKAGQPQ